IRGRYTASPILEADLDLKKDLVIGENHRRVANNLLFCIHRMKKLAVTTKERQQFTLDNRCSLSIKFAENSIIEKRKYREKR
ncbi:unnamed protein product, partial [Didymodactylos carnosus]